MHGLIGKNGKRIMKAIISSPFLLFCFVGISERKLNHVILLHLLKLLFMQLGGLMKLPELVLQPNAVLLNKVLEASKRLLGKPVQGKQSVDVDLVTKVAETFNTPQASTSNLIEPVLYLLLLLLVSCVVTTLSASTEVIFLFSSDHMSIFVLSVRMINVLKGISFILQGQPRLHVLFPSLKKCYLNCLIILFSL